MDKHLERLRGIKLLNAFRVIGLKFWKSLIMIWEMKVSTFIHHMFVIHAGENESITKKIAIKRHWWS